MLAEEVPLDKPVWGVHNDASRGLRLAHDSAESEATVELSHCVMAYRVALMAVTGQAERFGSAGLA
jgi:hypothetical protein